MRASAKSGGFLLVIAYLGFISLGLPDTLIGVAWPSVRDTFQLPQSAVALVFFGSGCSYFLSSFFTGRLLRVMGIGALLAASSFLVAASGFGYALAPLWGLFAACAFLHGFGSGAIDTGLNHYAAHHFSARHMNWLHACYSLGTTPGPLLMTAILAAGGSWRAGYAIVGSALLALSVLFAATRRAWDSPGEAEPQTENASTGTVGMAETLRHPTVWLLMAIFFFYTGLEMMVGQWTFTLLTESRSVAREAAGVWVAVYWASICVGRVLFGFVVDRIGIDRLLRGSMVAVLAGVGLVAWRQWEAATLPGLALIGLGLAPIYPCLMTRTPQRLGKAHAAHAIGFQVGAAMLGAAALPSATGLLAQARGLEMIVVAAIAAAFVILLLHEALLRRTP